MAGPLMLVAGMVAGLTLHRLADLIDPPSLAP
jgi:hypothetical protein